MQVELMAHTQLSEKYFNTFKDVSESATTDGQVVSLGAIRQCYSYKTTKEVLETEYEKYFGEKGKEGKRLFDFIVKSKHVSTFEHMHFSFAVEGVSRALLAQLTRHRHLSFSVQSQRYNKFSSDSRSGGFDYVTPKTISIINEKIEGINHCEGALGIYEEAMAHCQYAYNMLIKAGVPQEDARSVLPNAATCNLVTSGNLRAWLEFYKKRKKGNGAQAEIAEFAEHIKNAIIEVEPWCKEYFEL